MKYKVPFLIHHETETLYNYDVVGTAKVIEDKFWCADADNKRRQTVKYLDECHIIQIVNPDTNRDITERVSTKIMNNFIDKIINKIEEQVCD